MDIISQIYVVYVLVNTSNNKTYVGITNKPERRIRQHNGELVGGAKYTHANKDIGQWLFYGWINNLEAIDRVGRPLGVTAFGGGCLIGGENDHFWMSYRQVFYADIRARHPESDFQKMFILERGLKHGHTPWY